ncbi:MAG: ParB/RepB/Spo0J family partition protein [Proteobacteria bacterium]|nr:ParB/RepB/Spo0J family partition protein [Pseudomonadota bacterium]
MAGKSILKVLEVGKIHENPVALRSVNKENEDYLGLVESIRSKGFFGAITVREKVDSESGTKFYELIDGLHRFNAAKDAGLTEINCNILDMDDANVLEAQLMANVHKVETRAIDYTKQLLRMLSMNAMMTEAELAGKLGKSFEWLSQRLSLTKIKDAEIQKMINDGKIKLTNAYVLAKLPPEEQAAWLDRAITLPPPEFSEQADARAKEIRDAKRKGKDAGEAVFQPVAFLQKVGDIKNEMSSGEIGKILCRECDVKTPVDGFTLGISWVLHMDPKSVQVQVDKENQRKAEAEVAKTKRETEAAKKKAEKATKMQAEAAKLAAEAKERLNP